MLWIVNAQVLDAAGRRFARADIGIDGEVIREVVARASPEPDDDVIDLAGSWVLPGLIDCHVHLTQPTDAGDPSAASTRSDAEVALYTAKSAERTLLNGITTARDVGGWNYVEMAVRDAIRDGLAIGPRLFLAGRLLSISTSTVDLYPGMYEAADGADAVRAAARRQLARGADLIKVMATGAMLSSETEDARAIQFTLEELRAAVEIAHDNYKHVAAHAHACRGIENCVEAGVDSIEHCTFADDAVLARIAAAGIFVVPTICAGELFVRDEQVMASTPRYLRERMVDFNGIHLDTMRRAHAAGVEIAMGTDAGTPGNHHGMNTHEVVFMVNEIGMTPQQAIASSTIKPARLLHRQYQLGSIEPGKFADLIAMRTDPFDDITAVTAVRWVMKGGRVYRSDDL
ncbi:MAG: amidohydrolase family protein [Ilumatobacteraceae bacterium]